jgi:bifunctional ADP-heptose synthase (sugar kinase/adenylyltransferase)
VMALVLGSGGDYEAAARLANIAAGVSVSKFGTATVTPEELQDAVTRHAAVT